MQIPLMTGDLAHRIERALTLSWESRLVHLQRLLANPLGIEVHRGRRTSATLVARDVFYYGYFNAIRGLGVGGEDELDEALTWFRQHNRPCSVFITPFDANERLLQHLSERGVRPNGFMSVMYGVPEPVEASPFAVTVQAVHSSDQEPFLSLSLLGASDVDRAFLRILRNLSLDNRIASAPGRGARGGPGGRGGEGA